MEAKGVAPTPAEGGGGDEKTEELKQQVQRAKTRAAGLKAAAKARAAQAVVARTDMAEWLGAYVPEAVEREVIAEELVARGFLTAEDLRVMTEAVMGEIAEEVGREVLPQARVLRLVREMQGMQGLTESMEAAEIRARAVRSSSKLGAVEVQAVVPTLPALTKGGYGEAAVDIYGARLLAGLQELEGCEGLHLQVEALLLDPSEEVVRALREEAKAGEFTATTVAREAEVARAILEDASRSEEHTSELQSL